MDGMKTGTSFPPRAWVDLNLDAISHNIDVAREVCCNQTLLPVIKADGYGHGLEIVATQLMKDTHRIEGVAVAALSEVQRLRNCGFSLPIILLPGFLNLTEMHECISLNIEPVIHSKYQVRLLLDSESKIENTRCFDRVWLKANTGMNRLGMSGQDWKESFKALKGSFPETNIVLMSHLASADDLESDITLSQVQQLDRIMADVAEDGHHPPRSLAASGGILGWPNTHFDIVRPGIMLYGSSPFPTRSAAECGLKPVMTLRSRVVSVNEIRPGDAVGYGGSFVSDKVMRIGVVSIGYGDGYPRKAPTGTPVLVASPPGGAMKRVKLAGRVSMDMITIDLSDAPEACEGSEVVLWGDGLPGEEIASFCGTISYELFCQLTPRVPRIKRS